MNKALRYFFVALFALTAMPAMAAVAIKKAASVSTQQATKMDSASGLVGTVLTLASGVKALNQKVNEMDAECQPTSAEVTFVNEIVKEWAKTGAASAEDVQRSLRRRPCSVSSGIGGYQEAVERAVLMGNETDICFDSFRGMGNDGMVWQDFPRVGTASYCDDGSRSCGKRMKYTSDMYEIFNLVDFTEADYTVQEAQTAGKIIAKIEKCSGAKLSQAKRALWGEFLTDSIGNMGKKTSTASIMETVSGVVGSGGGLTGGLQSIGGFISNTMNK